MGYVIVERSDRTDLCYAVNDLLKKGWRPHGNPICLAGSGHWAQAMVLE